MMFDAIIVGGGVSGLACASRLRTDGYRVLLLESSDRMGGRIYTSTVLGTPVEMGASFYAGFYEEFAKLCADAAVDATGSGESQETWVCSPGRSGAIWPLGSLLRSEALSVGARARGLLGILRLLWDSRGVDAKQMADVVRFDNISVSRWSRRAFGTEFSAMVLEPLLRALFFWDTNRTSRALIPLVLKGVRSDKRFFRVSGGMSTLTSALSKGVDYRLDAPVYSVRESGGVMVVSTDEEDIEARAVVLACPANATTTILRAGDISVPAALARVEYSSISVGLLKVGESGAWPFATRRTVVVAGDQDRHLVAVRPITNDRQELSGIRVYAQNFPADSSFSEHIPALSSELRDLGLDDLAHLFMKAEVVDQVDWRTALPLFDVGMPATVASDGLTGGLPRGLFLAGDYTAGPHLEGAVSSGASAAKSVASFLGTSL